MTDRYKNIRKALEMGPTPGPWCVYGDDYDAPYVTAGHNGKTICLLYEDFTQFDSYVTLGSCLEALRNAKANAYFIAACDPDTIRELLAERDQLAAALAARKPAGQEPDSVWDRELSAVMPSDFKDWWESPSERPRIAAGVIVSLREREALAWEQVDQQAVPEDVRRDAARYRWLSAMATQQADSLGPIFRIDVRRSEPYLFNFDAAVDAARKEE